MNLNTIILILGTVAVLCWSYFKDKEKTVKALKMSKGRFLGTFKQIIGIMALIGLFLAVIPEDLIRSVLGGKSVLLSTIFGAVTGAVTIIPAFIAFPLASSLVKSGAHLIAIAAFITTLTMVGFATMPVEIEHFGKRFTYIRNLISFIMALIIAAGMGVLL